MDAPFLVIAHPGDTSAVLVAAALRRRHGSGAVEVVGVEELALAPHWRHELRSVSGPSVVELADGRCIKSDEVQVVFNRVQAVSAWHFRTSNRIDREYADMELFALFLTWLSELGGRVVNPPSPRGLAGAQRSLVEWLILAAGSGLRTPRYRWTTDARNNKDSTLELLNESGSSWEETAVSVPPALTGAAAVLPSHRRPVAAAEPIGRPRRRLLVAGDTVIDCERHVPPSRDLAASCRRLVAASGCLLLDIFLAPIGVARKREWAFVGADLYPAVQQGATLEAVVSLLEGIAGSKKRSAAH